MTDSKNQFEIAKARSEFTPISTRRLAAKELRETLRDRRTLITLFLMPMIVYPILSLLFQGFIASGFQESQSVGGEVDVLEADEYIYLFEKEDYLNTMAPHLNRGYVNLLRQKAPKESSSETEPQSEGSGPPSLEVNLLEKHQLMWADPGRGLTVRQMVSQGLADVGVLLSDPVSENGRLVPVEFTLIYLEENVRSVEAVRLFEKILNQINIMTFRDVMRRSGLPRFRSPVRFNVETVSLPPSQHGGISFAALIPLILTLMTITGAIYPAIDLTAGERERGTLESMIAAPIPRMRIMLGKLVAIVAVAMLTAVVNLVGMSITLWVFQFDRALFGEQGLTLFSVARIFGLLMLFAVFFSSVLLFITSFARSFKEGQAYLIPVMMVALAPSLMSLKPDLVLTGLWTVTPLVNIVLLSRDVLNGDASWSNAVITIGSTVMYSLLALTMAARFFGTPNVLYGEHQGIGSLLRRPKESRPVASASLALLCLALLFPASFVWQGVMVRIASNTDAGVETNLVSMDLVQMQLGMAALGLFIVFLVIPWMVASYHRVRFFEGFGVSRTSLMAIVAGVLMGFGFGPLLLQAIAWSATMMEQAGISNEALSEALVQRGEEYVTRLKNAPLWLIIFSMAIVPAVCEELFFRGLLFRSFRATMSPWKTIFATAVLFGTFHLISASGMTLSRLVPTTLMGIVLGWVCYRSGSVIPGIILHAVYNALTVSFAYFRDDLVLQGWITEQQSSVPIQALVAGVVCVAVGMSLLLIRKPDIATESPGDE